MGNDFLGRAPKWTTRWGIYVITIFFMIMLFSSFLISYNDVLVGEIEITTTTPSEIIKSPREGQITELLKHVGEKVNSGDIIAILNSSANYHDIALVRSAVEQGILVDSLNDIIDRQNTILNLGTVQQEYSQYQKALMRLSTFNKLKRNVSEYNLISKQLYSKRNSLNRLAQSLQTTKRNNDLVKSNHERMITLFDKGVISKAELETSEMNLLESVQQNNTLSQQYSEVLTEVTGVETRALESNFDGMEQFQELINQLDISKQELLNAIDKWGLENLLISQSTGHLSLMDVWSQYQNVSKGEEVFSISPDAKSSLIGLCKLPVNKFGKVKVGQKAVIKLYNYPYEEWGNLEGNITYLSEVPKQGEYLYYTAYVQIENLTTSFGRTIDFKRTLIGQSEIILEPSTLFDRLLFNTRKLFTTN